jgi:hypothetical protein
MTEEQNNDWSALLHHLEASSSYAEQLEAVELQRKIDAIIAEAKTLESAAGSRTVAPSQGTR